MTGVLIGIVVFIVALHGVLLWYLLRLIREIRKLTVTVLS